MNQNIQDMLETGYRQHQEGHLDEAERLYLEVLQRDRDNIHALNLLGMLCVNEFRPDEAVFFIAKALKLQPNNPESHANMALAYKDQGKPEQAVKHFRESIRLDPYNPVVFNNLGNVLREMSRPEEAIKIYERALKLDGDFAPCWSNLSAALNEAGKRKLAHRAVERALRLEPGLAQAHNNKGDILLAEARYAEALDCYRTATALNPKYAAALINMARTQRDMDEPGAAVATLRKALEIEPNNPEAHHAMGVLQEQLGNPDAAAAAFQDAIKVAPAMAIAHYYLAQIRGRKTSDEELGAMEKIWHEVKMLPNDRMFTAFGLARAYEQRRQFDKAFEFLEQGNRVKAEMQPYDDADTGKFVDSLADCSEAAAARLGFEAGCPDPRPVFILGMPRSGTSLTEQILASHSEVAGAGELSYAYDTAHRIREITKQAFPDNMKLLSAEQLRELGEYYLSRHKPDNLARRYVVDKTPLNFQYIGLLGLALPGAKFIHCLRDPVQNCFSIHKMPFDKKQAYAHSQQALGLYYNRYWKLMQRWKAQFPGRILDVRYEDTVADIETQGRRMLDFLDLPFEESVLDFYKTERLVKTPSASQVRQPIYGDAVQAWRKYEQHLGPLIEALDWEALGLGRPA
ncbi:MAG: tetratricopeptide repeat protein [Xanthomonadales bacterium]|nr:tetratricopeptide repeat protein [Xanthomonadales bacterium]